MIKHTIMMCLLALPFCHAPLFGEGVQSDAPLHWLVRGRYRIPFFSKAEMTKREELTLGEDQVTIYDLVCDDKKIGYAILQGGGQLVACSATPTTSDALKEAFSSCSARLRGLIAKEAPQELQQATGMPLVAFLEPTKEKVGLDIISCSVASLTRYFQTIKKLPLFGHPRLVHNPSQYHLPDEDVAWSKLSPEELYDKEEKERAGARKKGWRPFVLEKQALLRQRGLLEEQKVQREGEDEDFITEVIKDPGEAFRAVVAVRTRRLLKPVSPGERLELMSDELHDAEWAIGSSVSDGQVEAFVLQNAYLTDDSMSIEEQLKRFFLTRGLLVDCKKKQLSELEANELPCLAVDGKGNALVVVGRLVWRDEKELLLVAIPKTIVAKSAPLPEHILRNVAPSEKKKILAKMYPDPDPNLPDEINESIQALKAFDAKFMVVSDPTYAYPGSLQTGVHLVVGSMLSGYTAITITQWRCADNWWYSDGKEEGI